MAQRMGSQTAASRQTCLADRTHRPPAGTSPLRGHSEAAPNGDSPQKPGSSATRKSWERSMKREES